MNCTFTFSKALVASLIGLSLLTSCKKTNDPSPSSNSFRTKMDYSLLNDTIAYGRLFKDANGDSTVDRTEGKNLYHMFRGLNSYSSSNISSKVFIDSTVLGNLYGNFGAPFSGTFPGTTAAELNASGQSLKVLTAYSRSISDAEVVRAKITSYFGKLSKASLSVSTTASAGVAGKLGSYLVDEKGIEYIQVIQKGLIGAFQLDYIGNYLLSDDVISTADNSGLVNGKKYTALEHNFDIAYGAITLKNRYASAATSTSSGEAFIGSYMWEYDKDGYVKIHPAFLKGRTAIVNNDIAEVKAQALIIRKEMEKAIASAAIGYLKKWQSGSTDDVRAHAIGEGAGFIYSLRFCKINGGDDAFSDDILNNLLFNSTNGFWDLNNSKINSAIDKINAKFGF